MILRGMINKFIKVSVIALLTGCLNAKEARLMVVSDEKRLKYVS